MSGVAERVHLRPLAKGLMSYVVPGLRTTHRQDNPLGAHNALSCYSIFLRHLAHLRAVGVVQTPKVVAEFGPGSSLGVGLAALMAGTEKYFALDLIDHTSFSSLLPMFDALAALFRARTPVPCTGAHALLYPDLDHYGFPESLGEAWAKTFDARMEVIRADLEANGRTYVEVVAPWTQSVNRLGGQVDWLLSHSVMEHVDDLAEAYDAVGTILKPGGVSSHLIDFGSHGLTPDWNGHWAVDDRLWGAVRGRRPYLLNREPLAAHLKHHASNGLVPILVRLNKTYDGLIPTAFSSEFRRMSDEDARTRMALIVSRRD